MAAVGSTPIPTDPAASMTNDVVSVLAASSTTTEFAVVVFPIWNFAKDGEAPIPTFPPMKVAAYPAPDCVTATAVEAELVLFTNAPVIVPPASGSFVASVALTVTQLKFVPSDFKTSPAPQVGGALLAKAWTFGSVSLVRP